MTPRWEQIVAEAEAVISLLRRLSLKVATAESCTGGLIAAALTEVPGSSDVFERGYVTYSDEAKIDLFGPSELARPEGRDISYNIEHFGAVSRNVAMDMAGGALWKSRADIAVAVTGVAGPGGGTTEKPVGLVHLAATRSGSGRYAFSVLRLGDIGRSAIRLATVSEAFRLVRRVAE